MPNDGSSNREVLGVEVVQEFSPICVYILLESLLWRDLIMQHILQAHLIYWNLYFSPLLSQVWLNHQLLNLNVTGVRGNSRQAHMNVHTGISRVILYYIKRAIMVSRIMLWLWMGIKLEDPLLDISMVFSVSSDKRTCGVFSRNHLWHLGQVQILTWCQSLDKASFLNILSWRLWRSTVHHQSLTSWDPQLSVREQKTFS